MKSSCGLRERALQSPFARKHIMTTMFGVGYEGRKTVITSLR